MIEKREIRSLTGLRGMAALAVVAFHFSAIATDGHFVHSLFGPCYLAVDLFFLLSGFVMGATYAAKFAESWTFTNYFRFLERRFARVYPLYFVTVLFAFLLSKLHLLPNYFHVTQALLVNVVTLQNLGPGLVIWDLGRNLNIPTWSISTEVGAYLVFPWLASMALFRSRRFAAVTAALSVAGLVIVSLLPDAWVSDGGRQGPLDVANGDTLWPLLRCVTSFTLGLIIFRVSRATTVHHDKGWIDACIVAALLAVWFVQGADLIIVALFIVLVWQVCDDQSPLARLLGHPLPKLLGELSYAIYLIHFLVGKPLAPRLHAVLNDEGIPHAWTLSLLLVLALTLALSWFAYNFVERPARDSLRRVFDLRRSPISHEVAAP